MIGMITYIQYQLATKTFALIYMVPDRVSRWFGAGAEQLGEQQDVDRTVGIIHQGIGKTESAMTNNLKDAKANLAGKGKDVETPDKKNKQ